VTPQPALLSGLALGLLGTLLASQPAVMAALATLPPPSAPVPSPLLRGALHSSGATAAVGVAVYLLAGLCEIGGGWLVWQALRCGKPRWWAALGSLTLVAYGFVAALQPQAAFGRAFALYGGYFVVMSVAWGAVLDGFRPDRGDFVGCALVVAGIIVMTAWPRASAPPVA